MVQHGLDFTMTEIAAFDEMHRHDGSARDAYRDLARWLAETPSERFEQQRRAAEMLFRRLGITFAVYAEGGSTERLIPFDIVPRVISASEWRAMETGLVQRVKALNAFLHDIYHDQEILRAGRIPSDLVLGNPQFQKEMVGVDLPSRVYGLHPLKGSKI